MDNLRGIITVVLVRVHYSYWLLGDQKKFLSCEGIVESPKKKKKLGQVRFRKCNLLEGSNMTSNYDCQERADCR